MALELIAATMKSVLIMLVVMIMSTRAVSSGSRAIEITRYN